MLVYKTTGAIFSNDELGEKHERTVLRTDIQCVKQELSREILVSALYQNGQ